MQGRRGPRTGQPQRGNAPQYDITSGETWRPNPTVEPANAVKLYRAMTAMGASASGVINELLARMEQDERTGLPIWAEPGPQQGTIIDMPEPVATSGEAHHARTAAAA